MEAPAERISPRLSKELERCFTKFTGKFMNFHMKIAGFFEENMILYDIQTIRCLTICLSMFGDLNPFGMGPNLQSATESADLGIDARSRCVQRTRPNTAAPPLRLHVEIPQ